jgi:hypothetical protein
VGSNLVTYSTNYKAYAISNWTVAATPADRRRTTVGVAEEVNMYIIPADTVTWSTSAGSVNPASGSSTLFTAPSNAATATVTANYGGGSCTKSFTVLEPTGYNHAIILTTNSTFATNQTGAGMTLRFWIGPTNVSFYQVEIMEVGEDATNVTGSFTNVPVADLSHINHGADRWVPLPEDNSLQDTATEPGPGPAPWYAGGYTWNIPARWRVEGTSVTNVMTGWNQVITIDANGTISIDKMGRGVTRGTNCVITTR